MSGAAGDLQRCVVPNLFYPCLTVLGVAVVWLICLPLSSEVGTPQRGVLELQGAGLVCTDCL